MKKNHKITILLVLLIIENIILFYSVNFYNQNKSYKNILLANQGLTQDCKKITTSENLHSVLDKLEKYHPQNIYTSAEDIILSYGDEWQNNSGIAFRFDKDYKLLNKSCNAAWEPELPSVKLK